jgi:poly [ADP-ribose] polymerase 2/3/4
MHSNNLLTDSMPPNKKIKIAPTADSEATDQRPKRQTRRKPDATAALPTNDDASAAMQPLDQPDVPVKELPKKSAPRGRKRATSPAAADTTADTATQASPQPKKQAKSKPNSKKAASAEREEDDGAAEVAILSSEDQVMPDQSHVVDDKIAKADQKLHIPIDEGCPLATCRVYIEPSDSIIYDASLNQTNAGNNNNKFYRIQLLEASNGNYYTWTRWGRVGEHGQSKMLGGGDLRGAIAEFEKKFKDKSGLRWDDRLANPKSGVGVSRSLLLCKLMLMRLTIAAEVRLP